MINLDKLSKLYHDRLTLIYDAVKEKIYEDSGCCSNWVRKQFFENRESGFPEFVESLAIGIENNEISWYVEDEELIEYCFTSLRLADFLYKS